MTEAMLTLVRLTSAPLQQPGLAAPLLHLFQAFYWRHMVTFTLITSISQTRLLVQLLRRLALVS